MQSKTGKITLIILSILGMAVMGYLVSLHFSSSEGSFCDLGETLNCSIVNQSEYSKVLGIPMSILGFLYFFGVFGIALFRYNSSSLKTLAFFSILFMGPSLYLTGVELFILNSICIFCEISKVIILAIIITAFLTMGSKKLKPGAIIAAIVLAAVAGWITYAIQSRNVPDGTYSEFAQCLTDKNMIMYGSITCSFCAKQRALFGDAFKFATEIECDPRHSNDAEELNRCASKQISHTPTWILEDEEGNDVFRFDAGVQTLKKLSEVSECPLPTN
jgi:uncharacterized membrane protein